MSFTEEEMAELKEAFELFDKDKDGEPRGELDRVIGSSNDDLLFQTAHTLPSIQVTLTPRDSLLPCGLWVLTPQKLNLRNGTKR
jgi:hypothetical protein